VNGGGLAPALILGNFGGIVGLAGWVPRRSGGAALGLRLTALEVFPQCRGEPPLLHGLFGCFRSIVHGPKIWPSRAAGKVPSGARRLRHFAPCGKDRRARGRIPISRFHTARRCRSSVVEHPLGKGEVVSSILTGSTTNAHGMKAFRSLIFRQSATHDETEREHDASSRGKSVDFVHDRFLPHRSKPMHRSSDVERAPT
jgi:hypothetical protein